ncbi:zn2-c6 fungal-type dna-binding domain [Trichoderma arundinaceum]|uniref:Zn2-c6 fungal-type dna-binding domain n=1 Tax=Trichoderma arundinaceum TaxID=490622 RepID=A0A395P0D1_TRIAR|nr:zn2-c6 fungal-type dna-binding domain [Trichoderma arundinaceum]
MHDASHLGFASTKSNGVASAAQDIVRHLIHTILRYCSSPTYTPSMYFHNLPIFLFETIAADGSKDDTNLVETDTNIVTIFKAIVTFSKACFETIIRLYYIRHGFEQWDTLIVAYIHFMGFRSLKDLNDADTGTRDAVLSTVILCAKGLRDQGRNYYIGEAIFTILRDSLDAGSLHLLREFVILGDEKEERKEIVAQQINSVYPVNIFSIADNPDYHRLESLVQSYLALDFRKKDRTSGDFNEFTPLIKMKVYIVCDRTIELYIARFS